MTTIRLSHVLVNPSEHIHHAPMETEGFAGYLRRCRAERGWTQQVLSDRSGVSQPDISKYENGTILMPEADKRRRLAAALGVRHIDILVAAGELAPEEISGVAPRWPVDDERRVALFEAIEGLPDAALEHTTLIMKLIRQNAW